MFRLGAKPSKIRLWLFFCVCGIKHNYVFCSFLYKLLLLTKLRIVYWKKEILKIREELSMSWVNKLPVFESKHVLFFHFFILFCGFVLALFNPVLLASCRHFSVSPPSTFTASFTYWSSLFFVNILNVSVFINCIERCCMQVVGEKDTSTHD